MQKKIIALAVAGLMSGAAFAQTNVTLSGLVDLGMYHQSMQTNGIGNVTDFRSNGSSTSNLTITVTEDLGGGLKAGFVGSTDWSPGANNTTFLNSQNFLSLGGSFGTFQFGNINTAALTASSTSQPFATAIGSAYSGAFARLSPVTLNGTAAAAAAAEGETATGASGGRSVRANQSMKYITPSFSGFSASYQFAFRNDDSDATAANTHAGFRSLGLAYNAGALNVQFANEVTKGATGAAAATGGIGGAGSFADGVKLTNNLLGANYKFGPATIYGGYTTSKSNDLGYDSRSWNIAGKYDLSGNMALMANYVRVNDKEVTDADRSLFGLGFDYGMSKRTTAYARFERGDNDKSVNDGKFTRYQVGLRHAF